MTTSLRHTLPVLVLALAGCSDPAPTPDAARPLDAGSLTLDSGASTDTGASTDGGAITDTGSAADALGMDAPTPAADAPSGTDAHVVIDAPGLDAPGAVRLEIMEPYAYGNCFGGPPDPLAAFWTLRATGPAGERVTVDSASLRVRVATTGYDETQTLALDVPSFTIDASGTSDQMQRKESGSPSIPICTFCGETATGELTLQVSTGTGAQSLSAPLDMVDCVF
jgi:hypothetical protein